MQLSIIKKYYDVLSFKVSDLSATLNMMHMDQVMEVRLSFYLVLLLLDNKTSQQDSHTFITGVR